MKKTVWLASAILILLALCALPQASADAFSSQLYVEPGEETAYPSRVYLYEDDKIWYLFLPSGWDETSLRFTFPKESLWVNGEAFASGSTTDLLVPGKTVTFANQKGKAVYKVCTMRGDGIPSVFIDTESGSLKKLNRSKANEESGAFALLNADGALAHSGEIEAMRGRGNSSYKFNKKSYQVRLKEKANLLGMGSAKVYNLMADYLDISQLRSRISMDMAKKAGVRYALDCQTVNLYCNGLYQGTYLLTEKVGVSESRVDIYDLEEATEKANGQPLSTFKIKQIDGKYGQHYFGHTIPNLPEDISGGYILELQGAGRFGHKESGFITGKGMCVRITEPTCASIKQVQYIGDIFDAFHRAILRSDGTDPVTNKRYDELFDMDSMARVIVLLEICKTFDFEKNSLYFYKDLDMFGTKVCAGPVWDFDRSYGNVNTGFWLNSARIQLYQGRNKNKPWTLYSNLFNIQPEFQALVKKIFWESYVPALEILLGEREPQPGDSLRSLEAYRAEIEPSIRMNFTRWNSFGVVQIYKHSGRNFDNSYLYLKEYIEDRLANMKQYWAIN